MVAKWFVVKYEVAENWLETVDSDGMTVRQRMNSTTYIVSEYISVN